MLLHYIIWNTSPIFLRLGALEIRWYGLLFALGFIVGRQLWYYFLKEEKKNIADLDALVVHIMLGTLIGARLGHVLFYDFSYYAQHPLEIFLPVTFTPQFRFTGYSGLASHGAAGGILIAMYIYINYLVHISLYPPKLVVKRQRRVGQSYLWVADRMMIVVALAGCLIRIGNFMNSEILGKPTHSTYGVLFVHDPISRLQKMSKAIDTVRVTKRAIDKTSSSDTPYQPINLTITFQQGNFEENAIRNFLEHHIKQVLVADAYVAQHIEEPCNTPLQYVLTKNRNGAVVATIATLGNPRHPAQLYESFSCFMLCLWLLYQWHVKKSSLRPGTLFGWLLVIVFGLRIFYECFKEGDIVLKTIHTSLTTPQLLSLPLFIMGIVFLNRSRYTKNTRT